VPETPTISSHTLVSRPTLPPRGWDPMSVLKRIFTRSAKSRVQEDGIYNSQGLGVAGVSPRKAASLYSIPRRSRSVADGFVSLFVRERKVSTHTLGAPVEFRADPRAVSDPAAFSTRQDPT